MLLEAFSVKPMMQHSVSVRKGYVGALRYQLEGRGFDSRWGHWEFLLTSFRPHYDPGVDSAFNSNGYRGYVVRVKAAGA
jgi:hypothetical protein